MTDRPILFSGPMIQALLDGRKTQTRRALKPQPRPGLYGDGSEISDDYFVWEPKGQVIPLTDTCTYRWRPLLPYVPGDHLWVRETWAPVVCTGNSWHVADGLGTDPRKHTLKFKADNDARSVFGKWKPSIHMPRWASRLTLTVTDVRVERVRDISEEDAISEGVFAHDAVGADPYSPSWRHQRGGWKFDTPRTAFRDLWDAFNAKRGYGWDANPWVCVIDFTVHRCNVDQMKEAA